MKTAGILLVIAGIVALFYGGFSNTSRKDVPDMGLILVDDTQQQPVVIPPILCLTAIVMGGAFVYFRIKQGR
jgi:hypothetical protein